MTFGLSRDYYLKYFFIFLIILLVSLTSCLFALKYIANLQIASIEERFNSLRIGNELRQSSENLTKMARLYVLTGNIKYRKFYNMVLAIRDGKAPRPVGYNEIYWDLTIDKPPNRPFKNPESLTEEMIRHKLTLQEFSLLESAVNKSKQLTMIEIKAMNLMEGICEVDNQEVKCAPNQKLAQAMVSADVYRKQKAEIMQLVQNFFDLVYERTYQRNHLLSQAVVKSIVISTFLAIISTVMMLFSMFRALNSLEKMHRENDILLLNILPEGIALRLKRGEQDIADEFPQVSILFADIVNFSSLINELGAQKIVNILSRLFDDFDHLAEIYKVEKIKTIGDNYMAVAGLPDPAPEHAIRLAEYALALLEKTMIFNEEQGLNLQLRIGMTNGSVVAGIVGRKRFVYDVWGNVVNIASRLESTSLPNKIHVSAKMAYMLEENFVLEERGHPVKLKGYKEVKTYFLIGKK